MANYSQLSPLDAVNVTVGEWRVDPLPTNVTVINGTLTNGTLINGKLYNGTAINGTIIIERTTLSSIGTLPLISFIYLMMSVLVISSIGFSFFRWIMVALNRTTYKYVRNAHRRGAMTGITPREFDKQLRQYYRPSTEQPPEPPQASYPETVSRNPNGDFSTQGLRDFRELIREKYKLDCQIWNYRDAPAANRHIVDDMKRRSRGATTEMLRTVEQWEASREKWSDGDWIQVEDISSRVRELVEAERAPRYPAAAPIPQF